jgi:hypothetical protein
MAWPASRAARSSAYPVRNAAWHSSTGCPAAAHVSTAVLVTSSGGALLLEVVVPLLLHAARDRTRARVRAAVRTAPG